MKHIIYKHISFSVALVALLCALPSICTETPNNTLLQKKECFDAACPLADRWFIEQTGPTEHNVPKNQTTDGGTIVEYAAQNPDGTPKTHETSDQKLACYVEKIEYYNSNDEHVLTVKVELHGNAKTKDEDKRDDNLEEPKGSLHIFDANNQPIGTYNLKDKNSYKRIVVPPQRYETDQAPTQAIQRCMTLLYCNEHKLKHDLKPKIVYQNDKKNEKVAINNNRHITYQLAETQLIITPDSRKNVQHTEEDGKQYEVIQIPEEDDKTIKIETQQKDEKVDPKKPQFHIFHVQEGSDEIFQPEPEQNVYVGSCEMTPQQIYNLGLDHKAHQGSAGKTILQCGAYTLGAAAGIYGLLRMKDTLRTYLFGAAPTPIIENTYTKIPNTWCDIAATGVILYLALKRTLW